MTMRNTKYKNVILIICSYLNVHFIIFLSFLKVLFWGLVKYRTSGHFEMVNTNCVGDTHANLMPRL